MYDLKFPNGFLHNKKVHIREYDFKVKPYFITQLTSL